MVNICLSFVLAVYDTYFSYGGTFLLIHIQVVI